MNDLWSAIGDLVLITQEYSDPKDESRSAYRNKLAHIVDIDFSDNDHYPYEVRPLGGDACIWVHQVGPFLPVTDAMLERARAVLKALDVKLTDPQIRALITEALVESPLYRAEEGK
jgi:hypothetical protein